MPKRSDTTTRATTRTNTRTTPPTKGGTAARRLPRSPASRRASVNDPRFVKVELYLDASSARRILETATRYSITLRDASGKLIERPAVLRARLVEDPVEFEIAPRGFGGRTS